MENLVKKNEQERVGERKQTIKRKFNEEGGGGREGVVEPEGKRSRREKDRGRVEHV